jgi:hypothetical protein
VIVLRPLVQLLGLLWSLVLALFALGIALYCLDGLIGLGSVRPDRLLALPSVRVSVGRYLAKLEAPGHLAAGPLLCGLAAIVVALSIMAALVLRPRQSVALLDADEQTGVLGVRRRTIAQLLQALATGSRDVLAVKRPRVLLQRRGRGGRLRIAAAASNGNADSAVTNAIERALEPITEPFALRARIDVRSPRRSSGRIHRRA